MDLASLRIKVNNRQEEISQAKGKLEVTWSNIKTTFDCADRSTCDTKIAEFNKVITEEKAKLETLEADIKVQAIALGFVEASNE